MVVDNGVGGAAIQQDLLLKLVQHLRCDLTELQTQWLEVLRDAALNHLVIADESGGLDGCLVNLNPLVEIILIVQNAIGEKQLVTQVKLNTKS